MADTTLPRPQPAAPRRALNLAQCSPRFLQLTGAMRTLETVAAHATAAVRDLAGVLEEMREDEAARHDAGTLNWGDPTGDHWSECPGCDTCDPGNRQERPDKPRKYAGRGDLDGTRARLSLLAPLPGDEEAEACAWIAREVEHLCARLDAAERREVRAIEVLSAAETRRRSNGTVVDLAILVASEVGLLKAELDQARRRAARWKALAKRLRARGDG